MSGVLLTLSFPKTSLDWLAWIALVPLLTALKDVSAKESFRLGFIAGIAHYLTLTYWLVYTMKTYGQLPLYLCIPLLFLLAAYLGLYVAVFSALLNRICAAPALCFPMIPILWVAGEYLRTFVFSGFPWELLGYSQYNHLYLIQISDLFGVYGVSFLIALSNSAFFLVFLYAGGKKWQERQVSKRSALVCFSLFVLLFGMTWTYGKWRVASVDKEISASPSMTVAVVQGNIDQLQKWNPAFQVFTVKKYIDFSLSAQKDHPNLVVWPETSAPFYFLYNAELTEMLLNGVKAANTNFLIGSPAFSQQGNITDYYNRAYLIHPDGAVAGTYDKSHLVPFGEYVPLKKWLPFAGKIVEHVGDFKPGDTGKTILLDKYGLGVQICYEIIFPSLSREMVSNDAALLINITNDAWYGKTSAPYQHFSMSVFRAAENKRSLIRSANTGISGFTDPAGRVLAATGLFENAVLTRSVPLLTQTKTVYTRFGDFFAIGCLIATLLLLLSRLLIPTRRMGSSSGVLK